MINKYLLFIVGIILLINPVFANTVLINDINDTPISYSNNSFIDTRYNLDKSDSLQELKINYNLDKNKFPYNIVYSFNNTHGDILKIQETYTYKTGFIFNSINRLTTVYLNNNLIETSKSESIISLNYTDYNIFSNTIPFDVYYRFTPNNFIKIYSILGDIYKFNNTLLINQINLPIISGLNYNSISVQYQDNGIAIIQGDINSAYNSMNPVFKLIFIFFSGITKILSLTGTITNVDMYNYQSYFITPLQYIDLLISTFFNILRFISLMGIIWIFTTVECLIVIFNWIKTKDLIDTLHNTASDSYIVWNTIIIKPLNWIFTKLLLFWTGK